MENLYLAAVVREMTDEILGRTVARVSLAGSTLLFDLKLPADRALLVSIDPASPALYLADVDREQLDSGRRAHDPFISTLRKHLGGANIVAVDKDPLDRIVRITFQSFDAGGDRQQNRLVLSLTGRSANAWLLDSAGAAVGSFREGESDPPAIHGEEAGSVDAAVQVVDDSMTHEQVLERFFGSSSRFGPLLKREFVARSRDRSPVDALKSLLADLLEPVPLVYSRVPLGQIGQRIINLKDDLVLSHIDLIHTGGLLRRGFTSLSEAADHYYKARARAKTLLEEYNSARQLLTHEIKKRESAMKAIEADQARFDNPDKFKRFGDLILANLATARVEGSRVTVVDYYDPLQPEIQIELAENKTLQQTAVDYFSRYQKARRALTAIATRRQEVAKHLDPLRDLLSRLDQEPTADQIGETRQRLDRLLGRTASKSSTKRTSGSKAKLGKPGRRFISSDGFEVLVGRNDRDNEVLTFRVARSLDIWMHAGDYPGSHVVISNPSRNAVPQRTITEAAELAAFYSQAKREGKAAVHYTQRKFVSKPPRAKPGLVRLSSFKTLLVEPRCVLKRIE
jgi:predicted ribosome quality control (RQC) complex YloA/Tae2 family protein